MMKSHYFHVHYVAAVSPAQRTRQRRHIATLQPHNKQAITAPCWQFHQDAVKIQTRGGGGATLHNHKASLAEAVAGRAPAAAFFFFLVPEMKNK